MESNLKTTIERKLIENKLDEVNATKLVNLINESDDSENLIYKLLLKINELEEWKASKIVSVDDVSREDEIEINFKELSQAANVLFTLIGNEEMAKKSKQSKLTHFIQRWSKKFDAARIKFEEKTDIPKYHPDVKVFHVTQ